MDSAPRDITVGSTTQRVADSPAGDTPTALYLVRGGHLIPVLRRLADDSIPTLVAALASQPDSAAVAEGDTSQLPENLRVVSVVETDNETQIELSPEWNLVVGSDRQLAVAQIIMSLTSPTKTVRLRFRIDGKDVQVPTPNRGDAATVTDCDFRSLLSDEDEAVKNNLSGPGLLVLRARITSLRDHCGG
jgi:hypothetical protein